MLLGPTACQAPIITVLADRVKIEELALDARCGCWLGQAVGAGVDVEVPEAPADVARVPAGVDLELQLDAWTHGGVVEHLVRPQAHVLLGFSEHKTVAGEAAGGAEVEVVLAVHLDGVVEGVVQVEVDAPAAVEVVRPQLELHAHAGLPADGHGAEDVRLVPEVVAAPAEDRELPTLGVHLGSSIRVPPFARDQVDVRDPPELVHPHLRQADDIVRAVVAPGRALEVEHLEVLEGPEGFNDVPLQDRMARPHQDGQLVPEVAQVHRERLEVVLLQGVAASVAGRLEQLEGPRVDLLVELQQRVVLPVAFVHVHEVVVQPNPELVVREGNAQL